MSTDWWSVKGADESETPNYLPVSEARFESTTPSPDPRPPTLRPEQQEEPEEANKGTSRKKAAKVLGCVTGAVIVGLLILPHSSGEDGTAAAPSASTGQDAGDLPAAGGGPLETAPAASSGQGKKQTAAKRRVAAKAVSLEAAPAGKGRVGALVKVTIHNNTDEPVTVLASLVKGDGNRPAMVGEGTLAPGSRTIEPGQSATGTVEFSSTVAPHQIALLDWAGTVVAASN